MMGRARRARARARFDDDRLAVEAKKTVCFRGADDKVDKYYFFIV